MQNFKLTKKPEVPCTTTTYFFTFVNAGEPAWLPGVL